MNLISKADPKKKLRILLVGPLPPPMGGIIRYAQTMMASKLTETNEMDLFPDNIPTEYRPTLRTSENTWNIVARDGFKSTARVLAFVAGRMLELDSTLRKKPYDILHVLSGAGYSFFRNALHIQIARRYGVKTVFHLLGQIDDMYRDARGPMKRCISFCLDLADVHIVQSPLLAEFVSNITNQPVYSIFNGVKPEDFYPPDHYAHGNESEIRVITLGYLGFQKGTFDIIEAAELLKEKVPQIKFIFVGGGEIERFTQLIKARSLSEKISFIGQIDDGLRIRMLQSSDIFLLPSRAEGQPIALLEAMAAGLPVVTSTVGSIPEVVKVGVNGFLVSPGDIAAIAANLEMLAKDPSLRQRMGRYNAREAGDKYRLERVMQEILIVYEKIASRHIQLKNDA